MGTRIHIRCVAILACGAILSSAATAQNEQWLQYRSAEAGQIVGGMAYVLCDLSTTGPAGVKLPEFKAKQPLFLDWKTPLAAAGSIWLVFEKSDPNGPYDRLYIDANANGDLSDDAACEPYRRESNMASFGPLKIVFNTEEGPITYHLGVELRASSGRTYCVVSPACCYEGSITVGGARKQCVLIDYNVNGAFNDKSIDPDQCDRIRIGDEGGRDTRYVGNFIEVGDKLYRPEIARDGACITLTEAADVVFGSVHIAENITSFGAGGVNGLFLRKPENGIVKIPVGDYRVEHWNIVRNDDKGATWDLRGDAGGKTATFTVRQDREQELPIGEPIYSNAQYRQSGSFYVFGQSLQGRHGERITLTRNGSRPVPPRLRIRSRDGAYDRALSFEYG